MPIGAARVIGAPRVAPGAAPMVALNCGISPGHGVMAIPSPHILGRFIVEAAIETLLLVLVLGVKVWVLVVEAWVLVVEASAILQ